MSRSLSRGYFTEGIYSCWYDADIPRSIILFLLNDRCSTPLAIFDFSPPKKRREDYRRLFFRNDPTAASDWPEGNKFSPGTNALFHLSISSIRAIHHHFSFEQEGKHAIPFHRHTCNDTEKRPQLKAPSSSAPCPPHPSHRNISHIHFIPTSTFLEAPFKRSSIWPGSLRKPHNAREPQVERKNTGNRD